MGRNLWFFEETRMSKNLFTILADKPASVEENALIEELKRVIEAADCECRIIPAVDRLGESETKEALKYYSADAVIFAGSRGSALVNALRKESIAALSSVEKAELNSVSGILDKNLLTYHFQPIVSAATGRIYGYEALMRPTSGEDHLTPHKILKYADLLGRLGDVEKFTFYNILCLIDKRSEELEHRPVFINSIPGARLLPDDYLDIESSLLDHSEDVVIEITEQTEADETTIKAIKKRYEQLGIKLALDDYGAGYSNVINLLQYVPEYVKIDHSLINEINKHPKKQRFVREIIDFCHDNDILALAEGVETWTELRYVVRMGVDLIQGFYTAMPSPEIIREIENDVKREILRYRSEYNSGKKQQVFIADDTGRIALSSLAKADYSCILIGKDDRESSDVTLAGRSGLVANGHVEISANYTGKLILENAALASMHGEACIELGENSDVTLVLIGDNRLERGGIKVPASSSLTLLGGGNLNIFLDAENSYGIGNDLNSGNGKIALNQDGFVSIDVKGTSGIAVGSGLGGEISVKRGKYLINVNCNSGVCMGSFSGPQEINISDCEFEMNIAVTKGVGIGSLTGSSKVTAANCLLKCNAEGTEVSSYGSLTGENSSVKFSDGVYYSDMKGEYITAVGSLHGSTDFSQERATLKILGSGANALAFGGLNENTRMDLSSSDVSVELMTATHKDTFAPEKNLNIRNGKYRFMVNGYPYNHEIK